jgi:agmatinase
MKSKKILNAPQNPLQVPRFAGIATFSRLPHSQNLSQVNSVVVGIPLDSATTFRPGSRFAPRSIREASVLNRNYEPILNTNIYEKLKIIDYGDLACNPLNLKKSFELIEAQYIKFFKSKITPFGLGGDHSILYPIIKAAFKTYGEIGLIQFDAHSDTADQAWGEKYHHGTMIRRLIEQKFLKGKNIIQIGVRGALTSKSQIEWDKKNQITQFTPEEIEKEGVEVILKKINPKIPYYLSFDIDSIDPAFAPATGTPVVGGFSSREALNILRSLKNINFIGFDCVEVLPAYDHAQITSLLAATIIFECMALKALNLETKK